ncbi:MAG: hypothetical protein P8Y80_08320, partial [Acidobacteriota bacterium]
MALGKARSKNAYKIVLSLAVLILLLFILQGIFLEGKIPSIEIETALPAIGKQTPFQVKASESRRGLTFVKTELIQGNTSVTLIEKTYSVSSQFSPWGFKTVTDTLTDTAGVGDMPELQAGSAVIRVTVGRASTWLLHPDPEIREISLPVRLSPPTLQVTST